MNYIKQLDSIRAIAAFLVIIWHWIPQSSFINQFPNGAFGVNIFFVLSGFLITSILFSNRKEAEALSHSKKTVLKNFYIRRALRIFPIYFLTIALMVLLHQLLSFKLTLSELLASVTYSHNFYLFIVKIWPEATLHFWSLAVEEQFYLVWPLFMLFIPQRFLLHWILLFILIGAGSQLFITDTEFGYLLPHACFDALGIGALLAWITTYKSQSLPKFYRAASLLAIISAVIIVLNTLGILYVKQGRFAHALIGAWAIIHVLLHHQKQSIFTRALSHSWLIKMGKVSYGIYLYHILYYLVAYPIWKQSFLPLLKNINQAYHPWIFLVLNFGIFYFICWLSWKYIEKPILQLKTRFSYQEPSAQTRAHPLPQTESLVLPLKESK